MSLLVSLLIQGGRDLEEDNLEGTLFSRIVNKFDWMQDHISFTSEFASSTGYLSKKKLAKFFRFCLHFIKGVSMIPEEDFTMRFFLVTGAVDGCLW